MRVLAVAAALPKPQAPVTGIFIQREVEAVRRAGVDVVTCEIRYRSAPLSGVLRLRRAIRDYRPDVVHVHGGSIGAWAAALVGARPLVVSFRGSDLLGAARGDPWREQLVCTLAVRFSQLAAPRADAIIVLSEALRCALRNEADRKRAHVIPTAVDTLIFHPGDRGQARQALGWPASETIVLFGASRHRPVKRFDLALAAVEHLRASGHAVRLESLEAVQPARVPLYLNAADCLIVTSQHEGSPNIVKESVACGCPVVSVDVGDVRETLCDVTPSAVVAADTQALATGLSNVLAARSRSDGPTKLAPALSSASMAIRIRHVYDAILAARSG